MSPSFHSWDRVDHDERIEDLRSIIQDRRRADRLEAEAAAQDRVFHAAMLECLVCKTPVMCRIDLDGSASAPADCTEHD